MAPGGSGGYTHVLMFVSDAAGTTQTAEVLGAEVAELVADVAAAVDRLADVEVAAVADDELAEAMLGLRGNRPGCRRSPPT
jgi:hypothetical protein